MSVPRAPPSPQRRLDVIGVFQRSVTALRRAPEVLAAYAIASLIFLVLPDIVTNVLNTLLAGVSVLALYSAIDGDSKARNSIGVRLIILFVSSVLAGLAVLLGLLFLVVPGIYLAVRLMLLTPAVMVEDCGPLEALSRSFELTSGWTTLVFKFFVVLLAPVMVVVFLIVLPTGGNSLVEFLVVAVIGPVSIAGITVMYDEFRTPVNSRP